MGFLTFHTLWCRSYKISCHGLEQLAGQSSAQVVAPESLQLLHCRIYWPLSPYDFTHRWQVTGTVGMRIFFFPGAESWTLDILDKNIITELYLSSANYFSERISLCRIIQSILQYLNQCESGLCSAPFRRGLLYLLCWGAVFCKAVFPNVGPN